MSLAPAAYLIFRDSSPRPDGSDWIGRDRFVLSCGHSSLTLTSSSTCPATASRSRI